jgi:hypothetical protein
MPTIAPRVRKDGIAFFQRQTAADRDRFLSLAGKRLRRDLPLMLPANQRFFEEARDEHLFKKPPLDTALTVTFMSRFCR